MALTAVAWGALAVVVHPDNPAMEFGPRTIGIQSSGPLEDLIERSPNAIGITGVSSARLRDLKILRIDGVAPTQEHIAAERYPLYRPLFLVHPPALDDTQRDFLGWLLGAEAQRIIAAQGTVNLEQGAVLAARYQHWDDSGQVANLDALMLDGPLDGDQRHCAQVIRNSGEMLLAIINDILDFSKIEAGRMDLEELEFPLHTTVHDVVEILAENAHGKGLELLCNIGGGVPTHVTSDPVRLDRGERGG